MCCHRSIRAHENEYEPRDQVALYAHVECFTVWLSESRSLGSSQTGAESFDHLVRPQQD